MRSTPLVLGTNTGNHSTPSNVGRRRRGPMTFDRIESFLALAAGWRLGTGFERVSFDAIEGFAPNAPVATLRGVRFARNPGNHSVASKRANGHGSR